jgi:hypothetical protein
MELQSAEVGEVYSVATFIAMFMDRSLKCVNSEVRRSPQVGLLSS